MGLGELLDIVDFFGQRVVVALCGAMAKDEISYRSKPSVSRRKAKGR